MGAGHTPLALPQHGFPGSSLSVGAFVSSLLPAQALHTVVLWLCELVVAGEGYKHRPGHATACVPDMRSGTMQKQGERGSASLYVSCYQAGWVMDLWDPLAQHVTHPSTPLCIPGTCPCPGRVCSVSPMVPGEHCASRWRLPGREQRRAEVCLAWGT